MNTIYPTPALGQHYRLALEEAKQDYQDGLLTAAGLLYYAIGIMRKPGQEVRLSVREWLNLTGLKERTFYSAKAKLIATGRINEHIIGIVSLWICSAEDKVIELPTRAVNNDLSTGYTAKLCRMSAQQCRKTATTCKVKPQNPLTAKLLESLQLIQLNQPNQPNHLRRRLKKQKDCKIVQTCRQT